MQDFSKLALAANYGVTLERRHNDAGAFAPFPALLPRTGVARVLIVNSNPIMRAGLRAAIGQAQELVIIGEAADTAAAQLSCRAHDVSVAILDAVLDDLDVFETIDVLRGCKPTLPILVLYVSLSPLDVAQLLRAGVTGLVSRNAPTDDLIQAVRTVVAGSSCLPASFATRLFCDAPLTSGMAVGGLSGRELQVLRFLAAGFSNKEIARRLNLSVRTVETHRLNLRRKTRLSRPKDLVQLARRLGLLGAAEFDASSLALATP